MTQTPNNLQEWEVKRKGDIDYVGIVLNKVNSESYDRWRLDRNFCDGQLNASINFIRSELGLAAIEEYGQPVPSQKPHLIASPVAANGFHLLYAVRRFALDESKEEWLKTGLVLGRLLHEPAKSFDLTRDLAICYYNQGNYDIAIAYNEAALNKETKSALTYTDKDKGEILGNMGFALAYLGEYDKAVICYEQAIPILQKENASKIEGFCHGGLGWAYGDRGDFRKALKSYRHGLKLALQSEDKISEGVRRGAIGVLTWQLGEGEMAIEYLNDALKIAKDEKDKRREGTRLYDLAMVNRHLGLHEKAIQNLEESIAIASNVDTRDQRGIYVRTGVLGECHADCGNFDKALDKQQESLEKLTAFNILKYRVYATVGLGETYLMMQEYDKAEHLLIAGTQLANQVQNPAAQLTAYAALARVYLHTDRLAIGRENASEAVKYSIPQHGHMAHLIEGIVHLRLQHDTDAKNSFTKAIKASEDLLAKTPQLHRPKYTIALAYSGLALIVDEPDEYLTKAKIHLRMAVQNCAERGVVKDSHNLFAELFKQKKATLLLSIQDIFPQKS